MATMELLLVFCLNETAREAMDGRGLMRCATNGPHLQSR